MAELQENKKQRYTVLDILRGLCIISMVLYHGTWDAVYMFGASAPWYESYGAYLWQQSICWTFILLSGFCFSIGKRKLRRGLLVLACSAVISLVTSFIPGAEIRFGVLCLIGSCMVILVPLERVLSRVPSALGLALSFALFLLCKNIDNGYIGIGTRVILEMPSFLYANTATAYLGFPQSGFSSADYFPLLPWILLYICGYYLYRIFSRTGLLSALSIARCAPLEWLGRRSLLLYMIHQPVVYAVLYVIFCF